MDWPGIETGDELSEPLQGLKVTAGGAYIYYWALNG